MAHRAFHRELERLVGEVLCLGREVESRLGTMVEAVEEWDADVAGRVVDSGVPSRRGVCRWPRSVWCSRPAKPRSPAT